MSTASSRPSTPSHPSQTDHTSHPAHKLLTLAHPTSPTQTTQIFLDKILHKPLLLSNTETLDNRAARRHLRLYKSAYTRKHARPRPLSAKEKRQLHLHDLSREECRYEIYRGLNVLWRRYILEVLGYVDREGKVIKGRIGMGIGGGSGAGGIASADFHGMEVEVVRCVDAGRVGLKGIVVRETRSTITIVCDERETRRGRKAGNGKVDKVRMVLKKGTVFRVVIDLPTVREEAVGVGEQIGDDEDVEMKDEDNNDGQGRQEMKRRLVFELHGDQLEIRPIERAVKKFKWKAMDYL